MKYIMIKKKKTESHTQKKGGKEKRRKKTKKFDMKLMRSIKFEMNETKLKIKTSQIVSN